MTATRSPRGFVGVVAAGHPATVDAAATMLRAGGNAFDAVVAAGFAAGVAEPCLSSLGGGGFLLATTAGGESVLFDFFVATPGRGRSPSAPTPLLEPVTVRFGGASQVFHVGHGSIAVPGCLPGYLHAHAALGRLARSQVIEPARRLASEGVVLGPHQASVVRILAPIFVREPEVRARFVPEGRVLGDDERVVDLPLAAFLAEVAAGRVDGFGDPEVAEPIAAQMAARGGALTEGDLRGYRVIEREPLTITCGSARLLTNPPPSYGGRLIARALARLEEAGPSGAFGTGARLVQLAEVLEGVSREHTGVVDAPRTARGTTHISVADADGNLAAMTTSNGSGSGIPLGTTGVLANNIMGETDLHPNGFHTGVPGERVGSMMAPTVLRRRGAPDVALGSGGSERIRSALTQVIVNLLQHGMTLQDAVAAPRIHWDGTTAQVEPEFDPVAVEELSRVRPTNVWERTDLYFGGVNAVSAAGDRVGDQRRGGTVALVTA